MENDSFELKPLPEIPGQEAAGFSGSEGPVPAGFNERFVAYVVDALPFVLANYATFKLAVRAGFFSYTTVNEWSWKFFWIGLYIIYETVFSSGGRATLGKYMLNIRVKAKDGSDLSLPRAFARSLAYFLSSATFNLGYLAALVTGNKRALHDYVAGSRVISIRGRSDWAEGLVLAASWGMMVILTGNWLNNTALKVTPYEKKQIIAAHRTISKLAKLEEIYLRRKGHYTNDLRTLADLTGNVNAVRAELFQTLTPGTLMISSNGHKFLITAKAKNWRKTEVQVVSKVDAPPPPPLMR